MVKNNLMSLLNEHKSLKQIFSSKKVIIPGLDTYLTLFPDPFCFMLEHKIYNKCWK